MSTVSSALGLVERIHDAIDEAHNSVVVIRNLLAGMPTPGPGVAIGHAAHEISRHHEAVDAGVRGLRELLDPTPTGEGEPQRGECLTVAWCELAGEHRTHRRGVHTVRLGTDQYVDVGIAAVDGEAPWVQLGHVITVGSVLPAGMVRLSMTQARELGGGLVDVVHRFG